MEIVAALAVVETLRLARRMMITALKPWSLPMNFTKGMKKPRQSRKNTREPRELRETPWSEMGKRESRHKPSTVPRETIEEGVVIADQGGGREKKAGHGAGSGAGVDFAQQDAK
jgi:hypothetical protein